MGTSGMGADALSVEFAKAINCLSPHITNTTYESCDQCENCEQIQTFTHPDLLLIFPLPTGKKSKENATLNSLSATQISQLQRALEDKQQNLYQAINLQGTAAIRIQNIREIKKKLALYRHPQTKKRIILLWSADQMTPEAGNALLKTLEEPPEDTIFLLTAPSVHSVLPTILSRCQSLHLDPLSVAQLTDLLQRYHNLPREKSTVLAYLANGDYLQAIQFLDENIDDILALAIEFLRSALRQKSWGIHSGTIVERLQAFDRTEQMRFLDVLLLWLRCAWIYAEKKDTSSIPAMLSPQTIQKFVQHFRDADFISALTAIMDCKMQIQRNAQFSLSIYPLIFRLRESLLHKKLVQ